MLDVKMSLFILKFYVELENVFSLLFLKYYRSYTLLKFRGSHRSVKKVFFIVFYSVFFFNCIERVYKYSKLLNYFISMVVGQL